MVTDSLLGEFDGLFILPTMMSRKDEFLPERFIIGKGAYSQFEQWDRFCIALLVE
jgi:hypothetical protein